MSYINSSSLTTEGVALANMLYDLCEKNPEHTFPFAFEAGWTSALQFHDKPVDRYLAAFVSHIFKYGDIGENEYELDDIETMAIESFYWGWNYALTYYKLDSENYETIASIERLLTSPVAEDVV